MKTSYQQHFFFVLYPSLSYLSELSFPITLSTRLAHTSFFRSYPPLYINLSLSLLYFLPLISSPLVSLYSSHLLLSVSLSFFLSVSLSVFAALLPFLSRSPTVGKQLIMGGGGGGSSVIKATLSAERESWGRWIDGCRGTVGHSYE